MLKMALQRLLLLLSLWITESGADDYGPDDLKLNLARCKVTHQGTEFVGKIAKSEAGGVCQFWSRVKGSAIAGNLSGSSFPEGAVRDANNYCRNPNGEQKRPWCFTTREDIVWDYCLVPLCSLQGYVLSQSHDFDVEVCIGCLCEVVSGCNNTRQCNRPAFCGLFEIGQPYWIDGGRHVVLGDDPNADDAWIKCATDGHCAAKTVKHYLTSYKSDCDDDGAITCIDFAMMHNHGAWGCKKPLRQTFEAMYRDCRTTGPGMEYSGDVSTSASGRDCLRWKKTHYIKEKHKEPKYSDDVFPEGSRNNAGSRCRNPDSHPGGPWCYVEAERSDLSVREPCDIPFCDDFERLAYSKGVPDSYKYSHFTRVKEMQSFRCSFRLWNAADWNTSSVYVLLSTLDVACNSQDVTRWGSGMELLLSNNITTVLTEEDSVQTKNRNILSGVQWTTVLVKWNMVKNTTFHIEMLNNTDLKPLAIAEMEVPGKALVNSEITYFSLSGSPVFWNVSVDEEDCLVETTSRLTFTRFWQMKSRQLEKEVVVFLRGIHTAVLELRTSPADQKSRVWITFNDANSTNTTVRRFEDPGDYLEITKAVYPHIIDWWRWRELRVNILGDHLTLHAVTEKGVDLVLSATHASFHHLMWFGVGSGVAAHWTVGCNPKGTADIPKPKDSECVTTDVAEDYNGTQSVSGSGRQCLPWVDTMLLPDKYKESSLFDRFGGPRTARNYCRNLDKDPKGPYCLVRDPSSDTAFLSHCHPRSCYGGECRIAGTGNDYIGRQEKTRSGRLCRPWSETEELMKEDFGSSVLEASNFGDAGLEDTKNFCRNPSKSIGGPWCYTKDEEAFRDFCFINDCDRNLLCTVLFTRLRKGRLTFLQPAWRANGFHFWVKNWDPTLTEGLEVALLPMDLSKRYRLTITLEHVVLKFISEDGQDRELMNKTILHLIPSGRWGGLWLRPSYGQVELGREGQTTYFFKWASEQPEDAFEPVFMNYGTVQKQWLGMNLQCSECLIERTFGKHHDRYYPVNLWNGYGNRTSTEKLQTFTVFIRGVGDVLLSLVKTPERRDFIGIKMIRESREVNVLMPFRTKSTFHTVVSQELPFEPFTEGNWTELIVEFDEVHLWVRRASDGQQYLSWESKTPMLFSWFTVSTFTGNITWSANCVPEDIDLPPRDGNWSPWGPWTCSATCGKGEGFTERTCTNPAPNAFGKQCRGRAVYHGPCNDFPCGSITPTTMRLIRNHLSSNFTALQVDQGQTVTVTCNPQLIELIKTEADKVNITWLLNGFPVNLSRVNIEAESFQLVIGSATRRDTGVYLCMALQDSFGVEPKVILDVASVAVRQTQPTDLVRMTRSLQLQCNSLALSYVYADLSQVWTNNKGVWKDYGITTLEAVATDVVPNVSETDAGVWICVVRQRDFGFTWTTNWMLLKVLAKPDMWSHLMEDAATAPLFGRFSSEKQVKVTVLVTLSLLVATLIAIILACYFI